MFSIHWHDDTRKVLVFRSEGPWVWADALHAVHQQAHWLAEVSHIVHNIVVLNHPVPSENQAAHILMLLRLRYPNEGLNMIVTQEPHAPYQALAQLLIRVSSHVHQNSYRFVESFDQALHIIQQADSPSSA
jgi:hypothetical protein